jgi:hypothetical protein
MNRFSGKPLADLLKEGAEIEAKNIHVQPKGVFDARSGKFHSFETGERVKRPIPGLSGTHDVNVNQSAVLDRMIENNCIWGVGRGSSVASYVLYLLGVHRINSMYYELDPREFLR